MINKLHNPSSYAEAMLVQAQSEDSRDKLLQDQVQHEGIHNNALANSEVRND